MRTKILFPVVWLLAVPVARAGTILVIDDFTDPARIEMPGGPESVVTPSVGDLNAVRTLRYAGADRLTIAAADSSVTSPGAYAVAFEETGLLLFTDVLYTDFNGGLGTADLTQGGRYDAFFIDITASPSGFVPAVMLLLRESSGRFLIREFAGASVFFPETTPSRVMIPFSSFTRRDGVAISDPNFSSITELNFRLGNATGWPAWNAQIDRIAVGTSSMIPEPTSLAMGLFVFLVSASYRAFSVRSSRE